MRLQAWPERASISDHGITPSDLDIHGSKPIVRNPMHHDLLKAVLPTMPISGEACHL